MREAEITKTGSNGAGRSIYFGGGPADPGLDRFSEKSEVPLLRALPCQDLRAQ